MGGFVLFSDVFEDDENEDQEQNVDAGEEKIFDNAEDGESSLVGLADCRVTMYTKKHFHLFIYL